MINKTKDKLARKINNLICLEVKNKEEVNRLFLEYKKYWTLPIFLYNSI